jgi:hypothetical protein
VYMTARRSAVRTTFSMPLTVSTLTVKTLRPLKKMSGAAAGAAHNPTRGES